LHFLFAWRYFKAKKSTNAINVIAWISIGAIVIGTAALILVLSVFNGFEGLVKSLYSSFYTDLKVIASSGKIINVSQEQLDRLKQVPGIRNYALVAEEKAFIQNGEYQSIAVVKGVDDNYRYVSGVADHIVNGDYDLGNRDQPKLILGAGVENALGVQAERNIFTLQIYLPRKVRTPSTDLLETMMRNPMETISVDSIRTSAVFIIQQDFDNKYAFTNLDFVKKALKLGPDDYTQVEIRVADPAATDRVKAAVAKIFGQGYVVQDRYQQNQSLYSVMNLERWAIFAIASLILMVAAFNMISALRMLTLEKRKDITVLHAMGANKWFIQKIFLSEGFLLAILGGASGMLLALLVVGLQIRFHLVPLQGGSFLIDYFPVELRWPDFVLVGFTVFVIALAAAWLPARRAANQELSLRSE
jgi:lipoprotein-releasing system permease protein